MPPKRQPSSSAGGASKKAKKASPTEEDTWEPPCSARWSAVSASKNAAGDYWTRCKDRTRAYSYYTLCKPLWEDNEDDDDDDDNDKDKEDNGAGYFKFENQWLHVGVRIPDNFDMYVFNKYMYYGMLEIVQNMFVDFKEAEDDWHQQWAVCEGLMQFLNTQLGAGVSRMDTETVHDTYLLIGRMFLAMLARLDSLDLLSGDSEVKSLGCTMALYMQMADEWRGENILPEDDRKEYKAKKALQPAYFDDAILSYAVKRNITMRGPDKIQELIDDAEPEPELPAKDAKDPWAFKRQYTKYSNEYAQLVTSMIGKRKSGGMGGDALDFTTWSSAERKAHHFDKKDPLKKKDLDNLKDGMIMQMM
ncbi:hypothetical protein F4777DRAFT_591438 [Nemania sp. FL0916]|nr:hypothetical protein F4777DRAFT_591438 [Nemania sp. FL0916]